MKQMKDKFFLDTNILIYLYSIDEPQKREIVEQILVQKESTLISTQVINEFINVMLKKKISNLAGISKAIKELSGYFEVADIRLSTIEQAIFIADKYQYSYFDSLIISSALENKCSLLYTEDLHSGQLIENSLTVINPFKKSC